MKSWEGQIDTKAVGFIEQHSNQQTNLSVLQENP